jgi:hypothetical protein
MRKMLAKQLQDSAREIRNASKVFELELKKQRSANEATRQETVAWVSRAQEIRSENSVWKRENISLRAEVHKVRVFLQFVSVAAGPCKKNLQSGSRAPRNLSPTSLFPPTLSLDFRRFYINSTAILTALLLHTSQLTKMRDAKQAEIIQARQLEADENASAVQLQEVLNSLRAQIVQLEREKYAYRDQTSVLEKRTASTFNRQKSVAQVTSLIADTIAQSLAEPAVAVVAVAAAAAASVSAATAAATVRSPAAVTPAAPADASP